jgi:hypothetical protein
VAAAVMLATLPSDRKVLVEACAICGRQEFTHVAPGQADLLLRRGLGRQAARELA